MEDELTKDKTVEILYDHYKDTFENIKIYLQKRFTYTLICIGIITISAFEIRSPNNAEKLSVVLIKNKLGNVTIDFEFINAILSFGFMWIVVLYYQVNLLIEKQYKYIRQIEDQLSANLSSIEINREGFDYLNNYPWLLSVVHVIYTTLFPIIIIAVAIMRWSQDLFNKANQIYSWNFLFETIFLLTVLITSILYLINRHFNDFKK